MAFARRVIASRPLRAVDSTREWIIEGKITRSRILRKFSVENHRELELIRFPRSAEIAQPSRERRTPSRVPRVVQLILLVVEDTRHQRRTRFPKKPSRLSGVCRGNNGTRGECAESAPKCVMHLPPAATHVILRDAPSLYGPRM